jgi:hypothetical protein
MTDENRALKVFLCHAHSDKDAVKALYARLKREGVDVWLAEEKLLPGADWELEIRKAVREADVVVVCLSKQFNQAGFRQKEVRIALEEADKKPEGEIFIIPARLEECDNLENLSRWHWVDLFEKDGFQRLIFALHIRADKVGATLRLRKSGHSTTSHANNKIYDNTTTAEPVDEKVKLKTTEETKEQNEVRRNALKSHKPGPGIIFIVILIGFIGMICVALISSSLLERLISPTSNPVTTTFVSTKTQAPTSYIKPELSSTSIIQISTPTLNSIAINKLNTEKGTVLHINAYGNEYEVGPLSNGTYALGPNKEFFVYCTYEGHLYASRFEDKTIIYVGKFPFPWNETTVMDEEDFVFSQDDAGTYSLHINFYGNIKIPRYITHH